MKRFALLIFILLISLQSCGEEKLLTSPFEYGEEFQNILSPYENYLSEYFFFTLYQMIDLDNYQTSYHNLDMRKHLTYLVDQIGIMAYRLSLLEDQQLDDDLLQQQTILLQSLNEISRIYKSVQENPIFDTQQPSQFTLYTEVYFLLDVLSEPLINYNTAIKNICNILGNSFITDQTSFINSNLKNRFRFDYIFTVLSSQVATYGDYTNMIVNPNRSEFIYEDGVFYRVSELNSDIMNKTTSYLQSELNDLNDSNNSVSFDTSEQIVALQSFLIHYKNYFDIRQTLPDDFFSSGTFKSYQSLSNGPFETRKNYMTALEKDLSALYYQFDPQIKSEYDLILLDVDYMYLQTLLFSKEHQKNMFYTDKN